jgi:hypothetical protein
MFENIMLGKIFGSKNCGVCEWFSVVVIKLGPFAIYRRTGQVL